jgi:cytoskeletal protein RodZ
VPRVPIAASPSSEGPVRAPAPAASGPVVVALTEDLSLLEALGGAVSEGERFTAAPTMERFADLLIVSGADLAVIDCALLDVAPGAFFSRVHAQFPRLTLLAIGDSTQQQQLNPQLADGTILRFAHRPLSAQRLGLFLETARRHREGAQALAGLAAGIDTISTRFEPPRTPRASFRPWWLILALGVLLGAALWWWWPGRATNEASATLDTRGTASTESEPTNSAAAPALADTPSAAPSADAEVQHWVELAGERMQEGALIAPANDNAQSYISAAAARAPQNPAVRAAAYELGERLISATRSALATGDLNSAQRWLAAAKDYRVGATTLAQLDTELAQARSAAASALPSASSAPSASAPGATP